MYKKFNTLCPDAIKIRTEVFSVEQGFDVEYDDIDSRATHLVFYDNDVAYGTCRYFTTDQDGEYMVGRVAVTKPYRGKGLGNYIMQITEENALKDGATKISLSSQLQAKDFYLKNGYIAMGDIYMDQHCEHIHMEKILKQTT